MHAPPCTREGGGELEKVGSPFPHYESHDLN